MPCICSVYNMRNTTLKLGQFNSVAESSSCEYGIFPLSTCALRAIELMHRLNTPPVVERLGGELVFLVPGVDRGNAITYGRTANSIKVSSWRDGKTFVTEFYGVVIPGLRSAEHQFTGLERPLQNDNVLVSSWRPEISAVWVHGPNGHLRECSPPAGCVFVVFSRPNENQTKYPGIDRWINHWTWIGEDKYLPGAPKNWVDRFSEKVWSRG